jgi:hypothetical protein
MGLGRAARVLLVLVDREEKRDSSKRLGALRSCRRGTLPPADLHVMINTASGAPVSLRAKRRRRPAKTIARPTTTRRRMATTTMGPRRCKCGARP